LQETGSIARGLKNTWIPDRVRYDGELWTVRHIKYVFVLQRGKMMTLKIDRELGKNIQIAALALGISKSELVRNSVEKYLETIEKPDALETGHTLFGKYSSGKGNPAKDRKSLLKEQIKATL
jgi:hypothetical protein